MVTRMPETNRRQFLGTSGATVAGSMLAARGLAPRSAAAAVQDSGQAKELRYLGSEVTTLDTYQYSGGYPVVGMLGLKEGLVEYDENWEPRPLQSEGWEWSPDGLRLVFTLRQDNTWHDGSPVTAHDYVTAIRYQTTPGQATNYGSNSPFRYLVNAEQHYNGAVPATEVGATAVDDYTLQLDLAQPYPAFLNAMPTVNCYPMSTVALEHHGEAWADPANFIGNGPYQLEEFVLQSHISVVPYPGYNLERGNLERVTSFFQGRQLEAYQAGEIDLVKLGAVSDLVVAQNDDALSQELLIQATTGLEMMGFLNNSDNGFYLENPKVRQAIAKSFDMASIIEGIWLGIKEHVPMLSEPIQPDFNSEATHSNFDLAAAQQLLAEAGFPEGEGLPAIRYFFPSYQNQDYVATWTAVADQLKDNIGLDVELRNEEIGIFGQHYTAVMNEDPWFGMAFMASGKPWRDPMHAWDSPVVEFDTNDQQIEFARLFRLIATIGDGTTPVEGGEPADFDAALAEITSLREQSMAVFADGAHGEYLREIAQSTFDGWVEQATTHVAEAATDQAANWQAINVVLARARTEHFLLTNRRPNSWLYYELEQEALWAASDEERLALAARVYDEVHAVDSWRIPLYVANSVHLTKPYVTGARWVPFWWGDLYQAKTININ